MEADTAGDGYSGGTEVDAGADPLRHNPAPELAVAFPVDGSRLP